MSLFLQRLQHDRAAAFSVQAPFDYVYVHFIVFVFARSGLRFGRTGRGQSRRRSIGGHRRRSTGWFDPAFNA